MADTSVAPTASRKKGQCSGCGSTKKTVSSPGPVGHDYAGPMYCMGCNPALGGDMLDAQWSALERMAD